LGQNEQLIKAPVFCSLFSLHRVLYQDQNCLYNIAAFAFVRVASFDISCRAYIVLMLASIFIPEFIFVHVIKGTQA